MVSTDLKIKLIRGLALCLVALTVSAAVMADNRSASPDEHVGWVDARHRQISARGGELAEWADNFFGGDKAVEESATSILRVRPQFEWDEQDDTDWKLRAAGRFYLPRSRERLSLVFFGEDGDFEGKVAVIEGDDILADLDTLEAQLNLPVEMYGQLEMGRAYRFIARQPVNREIDGKLRLVIPLIDTASQTFRCIFTIDNRKERLPAGFTVYLKWPQ